MATSTHIPLAEISDLNSLLERARNDRQVVIDGEGESFTVTRLVRRSLSDILADKSIQWSNVVPDASFADDLDAIVAERKTDPYVDPWA